MNQFKEWGDIQKRRLSVQVHLRRGFSNKNKHDHTHAQKDKEDAHTHTHAEIDVWSTVGLRDYLYGL